MHSRAQHDGEEADERIAAFVVTARVGGHRERLDRRVPHYCCGEAALMIPKDEDPASACGIAMRMYFSISISPTARAHTG